jgi:hypothetical protein
MPRTVFLYDKNNTINEVSEMIGGIVMVFAVIWMYQGAMKAKVGNVWFWAAVAAVVFFATQAMFDWLNVYILESFRSSESTAGYEKDLLSVGDRKNEGGFEGGKGVFLSTFFELMPPLAGFIAVALVRMQFILKVSLLNISHFTSLENFKLLLGQLFSGLGDMFVSIKDSFKNNALEEEK